MYHPIFYREFSKLPGEETKDKYPPPYDDDVCYVENMPYPISVALEGLSLTGKTNLTYVATALRKAGISVSVDHSPNLDLTHGAELKQLLQTTTQRN